MIKAIFCDLDETLIDTNHQVLPQNKEAIKQAQAKGVKFIVCSGRGVQLCEDVLKQLDLLGKENEYLSAFNGGTIVDLGTNQELYFKGLSFEITKLLFEYGFDQGFCMMVFTSDNIYLYQPNDYEVQRKINQKAKFEIRNEKNMDDLKTSRICKIIYVHHDFAYLHSLEENLKQLTNNEVEISYSSGRYMEFNPHDITKGNAVKFMADYLNIDLLETMAIGDSENDMTMIQTAGIGVVVNNAEDKIKVLGDYVTKANFDEGAVKEAIEKFVL